jgi:tRNA (guanine37-N1)-methyltransferase
MLPIHLQKVFSFNRHLSTMDCKCVKVISKDGESTRQTLISLGILNHSYKILQHEGYLYMPLIESSQPPIDMEVGYMDLSPKKVRTLPSDLLPFNITYERIGDIILLNEPNPHNAASATIALMASDVPSKTIMNKASEIQGDTRIRKWDILFGTSTETLHREHGSDFFVDMSKVYFSPRLATERKRIVDQVVSGEKVFDMFSGIGPFSIPIANKGAEVIATDINQDAIDYLLKNIDRNNVGDNLNAISGDVRELSNDYLNWADRIIMNLPHSANNFLDVAFGIASDRCVIHYYDISDSSDPFSEGQKALNSVDQNYEITLLNKKFIRSYSPAQANICIDALITRI